jgi:hypothetical protein
MPDEPSRPFYEIADIGWGKRLLGAAGIGLFMWCFYQMFIWAADAAHLH